MMRLETLGDVGLWETLNESTRGERRLQIQLDSGRVRLLETDVGEASVSRDGQWVARRCRKPACGSYSWLVGPSDSLTWPAC